MIRWPRKIRNNELYEKNPFKTCVYWGNQTEMEPTWTHPQTRQKKANQKSLEIHVWQKVK